MISPMLPISNLHTLLTSNFYILIFLSLFTQLLSHPIFQFHQYAYMIPHPEKAHRGGEDAFFSNDQILIVSDGVGGWNSYGIDPAKFSRFLCSKGAQLFHQNQSFYRHNLVEIIAQASHLNDNLGSATMVVTVLQDDQLRTCYIGDSGFVIFRLQNNQYTLHFQFKQQQHSFNFPFQLARKDYKSDDPYSSICQDFKIQQHDIVIVGSDGLFDNVYVEEILQMVNESYKNEDELFGLREKLARLAIERGKDESFWSPFAQRAKEQSLVYRGGKLDDTTVIISKIRRIEDGINEVDNSPNSKEEIKTDDEM